MSHYRLSRPQGLLWSSSRTPHMQLQKTSRNPLHLNIYGYWPGVFRQAAHSTHYLLPFLDCKVRSTPLLGSNPPYITTNLPLNHFTNVPSRCFPTYCTVLTSRPSQAAQANPLPVFHWSRRPPQLCLALDPSTDSQRKYMFLLERKVPTLTS